MMNELDEVRYERRSVPRTVGGCTARLRPNEWSSIEVELRDFSKLGFRVATAALLPVGSFVSLEVPGIGHVRAKVVWRGDGECGAKFIQAIDLRHCEWIPEEARAAMGQPTTAAKPDPAVEDALVLLKARLGAG
jgi:hypothetical protein